MSIRSFLRRPSDALSSKDILPSETTIITARDSICDIIPEDIQSEEASQSLIRKLLPGLNKSSKSARYYGFVTGGATPISKYADNCVTEHDQNVQVHLPRETIATNVEDAALKMLCQLVYLDQDTWNHRTFTTGATASNVMGLVMGRQFVVEAAGKRINKTEVGPSVAHLGLFEAMQLAHISEIQVLTTAAHSSIKKAAAIAGLGQGSVHEVGHASDELRPRFDFELLERYLQKKQSASIIVVSCGEVNTGFFATADRHEYQRLRDLAYQYGAWIHVDAAIGLLARILHNKRTENLNTAYKNIMNGVEGLELADSIAGDAHKLLNVPYDCGIFLSRHLPMAQTVFENPGANYLSGDADDIPSPLNIGIENSRRFRALPVYANLIHFGRLGYENLLKHQIDLARGIASLIQNNEKYELLPPLSEEGRRLVKLGSNRTKAESEEIELLEAAQRMRIFMIVCFRAVDEDFNKTLVQKIKEGRSIYISGTQWEGRPAARIAISNWQVNVEKDLAVVKSALEAVCSS